MFSSAQLVSKYFLKKTLPKQNIPDHSKYIKIELFFWALGKQGVIILAFSSPLPFNSYP